MTMGSFRLLPVLAVLMLPAAREALGQVHRVKVQVDGLACPFCVFNVEKRVKTMRGLDRKAPITTSIEAGVATFAWKPNVEFDPEAVRKAIREAGFTPRRIEVTAAGRVLPPRKGDPEPETSLRLAGQGTELLFRRPEGTQGREAFEALRALTAAKSQTVRVRAEGEVRWVATKASSWEIVLDRWAPLAFGAHVVAKVDALADEGCSTRLIKALRTLDGVLHVQADHEEDHVQIWTEVDAPDLSLLRGRIELLGFKVTHIQVDGHHAK